MRRLLLISLSLCLWLLPAAAQELPLLDRILAANMPSTLQARWTQVRHSSLLEENLESRGIVALQQPDLLRWEVQSPVVSVTVLNAASARRFKLPTAADFKATVLEDRQYTVLLEPLRRDLRPLFERIVLQVDKSTLQILDVVLTEPGGDWSRIAFTDVKTGMALDPSLFE